MKRRLTAMVAACCLAMQLPVFAGDIVPSGASVYLNGEQLTFDVPPMNQDGRTLVPMRAVLEALGATVDWDGAAQRVTAQKDAIAIDLIIGSQTAYVNGQAVELDVPAVVYNDRTLVPLRFVSEKLGLDVQYNGEKNRITIVGSTEQTIVLKNGGKYVGEVKNGVPNGYGKWYDGSGTLRQEGYVKDGYYSGEGTEYDANGVRRYKGGFLNDKYSGYGTLYDSQGYIIYEGPMLEGKPHGQGKLYLEDGSVQSVKFENGELVEDANDGNTAYRNGVMEVIDTFLPDIIKAQQDRAASYESIMRQSNSQALKMSKLEMVDDLYYSKADKIERVVQDQIERITSNYYKAYGKVYDPSDILYDAGIYYDKNGRMRFKNLVDIELSTSDWDDTAAYEEELRQINDYYDEQIEALETAQEAMSSSVIRDTMGAIQSANGGYMNSAAAIAATQAGMNAGSYYADKIAALEDAREREIADLKARYGIR